MFSTVSAYASPGKSFSILSAIIRCGLETLLRRLPGFRIQISVYDSADELKHKLERLNTEEVPPEEGESDDQQTLSSREKEIVVCESKHGV